MVSRQSPLIRTAFVPGAGLGTRLGLLTDSRPKPLIPVCQKPLITFAFDALIRAGVTRLLVNTHRLPEAFGRAFPGREYRNLPIHFEHEPVLLETAGGIKNIAPHLGDEPFIVYNGDVLSDLPLDCAIRHHFETGNEVTLLLRSSGGPLEIAFDASTGAIVDIGRRLGSAVPALPALFTGIYVVNPAFLARIPPAEKISVVPIFLEMIRRGEKLGGILVDEGNWWDLGTRERYLAVHRSLYAASPFEEKLVWIHPTAQVAAGARLEGATVAGPGVRIGASARLKDCILWEGAEVAAESDLDRCIVRSYQKASGTRLDADI